jgi:hypothetical protein
LPDRAAGLRGPSSLAACLGRGRRPHPERPVARAGSQGRSHAAWTRGRTHLGLHQRGHQVDERDPAAAGALHGSSSPWPRRSRPLLTGWSPASTIPTRLGYLRQLERRGVLPEVVWLGWIGGGWLRLYDTWAERSPELKHMQAYYHFPSRGDGCCSSLVAQVPAACRPAARSIEGGPRGFERQWAHH